jgi:hypothetical protein
MSALVIAGVTAVLRNLTLNYFSNPTITANLGTTPVVSAVAPDLAASLHTDSDAVNWFMYRTASNSGLGNAFMPNRNSQGERTQRAPLAIDLHYLFSAYGNGDMHAEVLMGYALQLFHENPILDRDAITAALAVSNGGDANIITALIDDSLPDRLERIKLAIHHPDDELLSKLWGAFNTQYRSSVIVEASVVLIESDISVQPGLPVQRYEVDARPLILPHIDRVVPAQNPAGQVSAGDAIVIQGNNLAGEVTRVAIADIDLHAADVTTLERSRIEIPGSALTGLPAGVNAVQVKHDLLLGVPEVPHRGFQSNVVPLIIHPNVSNIMPTLTSGAGSNLEGQIQVTIEPPVKRGQRVNLLLNDANASSDVGYNFNAEPITSDTPVTVFTFEVMGIVPGNYFIRVQVHGAASLLSVDPDTRLINETPIPLI